MSRNNQLPAGWEWKKLGEVCEIVNGSTPLRTNKEYWENGNYPWFTIDDIREQGRIITSTKQKVTEAALSKLRVLPTDTVLLCCTASVGEYAIAKIELTTNQQFNGLIVKDKKILVPEFLMHYCSTLKDKLLELSGKTTIDFIAISKIKVLEIPLPPLPEQQRIVAFLDEAFAAIAQAKAHAEQNLQNAKALFESYLQGVFASKGSATGGGEWEEKKLQDVARVFGRGKSKYRPRNWAGLYGGDYPFIQTGDVRNANKFITNYSQTYNDVGLAQSKLWKKGTICITIAANIAETAILDFDGCIPDSIIGFEVDDKKADLNFVYYLLQSFKSELQKLGKGSAQDNINLGTFENQYFPFPPLETQQTIVRQLDALRAETQRLEAVYRQKWEDLEELKKSLLIRIFGI